MNCPQKKGKVLLVNPNRMKPPVAPIALDYLAHALVESQFDVDILDLCFADDVEQEIENYFARHDVLAVAVSLRNADDTFFVTRDFCIDRYKDVINDIKRNTAAPKASSRLRKKPPNCFILPDFSLAALPVHQLRLLNRIQTRRMATNM